MDMSDDEELDPELLAELSLLGEISEAEIEAERQLILRSETTDPQYPDFEDSISTVNDGDNEFKAGPDPLAGPASRPRHFSRIAEKCQSPRLTERGCGRAMPSP